MVILLTLLYSSCLRYSSATSSGILEDCRSKVNIWLVPKWKKLLKFEGILCWANGQFRFAISLVNNQLDWRTNKRSRNVGWDCLRVSSMSIKQSIFGFDLTFTDQLGTMLGIVPIDRRREVCSIFMECMANGSLYRLSLPLTSSLPVCSWIEAVLSSRHLLSSLCCPSNQSGLVHTTGLTFHPHLHPNEDRFSERLFCAELVHPFLCSFRDETSFHFCNSTRWWAWICLCSLMYRWPHCPNLQSVSEPLYPQFLAPSKHVCCYSEQSIQFLFMRFIFTWEQFTSSNTPHGSFP